MVDYYGNSLNEGSQLTTSFRGGNGVDPCSTWPRNVKVPQECPEGVNIKAQGNSPHQNSPIGGNIASKQQAQFNIHMQMNPGLYHNNPKLSTMPKLHRQHSVEKDYFYNKIPMEHKSNNHPENVSRNLSRQYSLTSIIQEGVVYPNDASQLQRQVNSPRQELVSSQNHTVTKLDSNERSQHQIVTSEYHTNSDNNSTNTVVVSSNSTNTLSSVGTVPSLILQPPSLSSYTSDSEQGSEITSSFCST